MYIYIYIYCVCIYIYIYIYMCVTLEHKTSLKSLGYICNNSQKYIVWVKIIDFSFMPKIIRRLSKDHVPWRYFYISFHKYIKTSYIRLYNFKGDFLNI